MLPREAYIDPPLTCLDAGYVTTDQATRPIDTSIEQES
jgi:hypothetical protein